MTTKSKLYHCHYYSCNPYEHRCLQNTAGYNAQRYA